MRTLTQVTVDEHGKLSSADPQKNIDAALAFASRYWELGLREQDDKLHKDKLDEMVKAVGFANRMVWKSDDRALYEWCGFFAAWCMLNGGMSQVHAKSFYAARNLVDFFNYKKSPRVQAEITFNSGKVKTRTIHVEHGALRLWIPCKMLHKEGVGILRPGDIVLIDHQAGAGAGVPDHITVVSTVDVQHQRFGTIEGNASGMSFKGNKVNEAVVVNTRTVSSRIHGAGRLSALDFDDFLLPITCNTTVGGRAVGD